jgi:3-methyladenine DNA glycosylase AlkD
MKSKFLDHLKTKFIFEFIIQKKMKTAEIVKELKSLGSESIKKVLVKHGAKEPFYGVKVEDLKKISKKIKGNQELAMELYDTGISDAMYLAGIIAEGEKMTKKDIEKWAENASWQMISEYTVAWVASESKFGEELADKWIESKKEKIASSGWSTYGAIVSIKPDENLDIKKYKALLDRVAKTIHTSPNRVRSTMNVFIISVGAYVKELTGYAQETSKKIGTVMVDVGDTACKVPSAYDYIEKIKARGTIGKKKKTVKC